MAPGRVLLYRTINLPAIESAKVGELYSVSDARPHRKDNGELASNPHEWQWHDLAVKVHEVALDGTGYTGLGIVPSPGPGETR